MANNSQMFARLLPIDIKFFNGESPSPQKMNGIFNYVHAAFYILESFLGNGIDYRIPSDNIKDRKMLFNVSQVLGNTGKLYKPVNTLVMTEYLHRSFGIINKNLGAVDILHASHTTYDQETEQLTIRDDINIPVCINTLDAAGEIEAYYIGLYYTGEGSISIYGGGTTESQTLTLPPQSFRKFFWFSPGMEFIDYIKLSPGVMDAYGSRDPLVLESIYLVKGNDVAAETQRIYELVSGSPTENYIEVLNDYNTSYAIPLDNMEGTQEQPTFWTIQIPCKWAISKDCSHATCDYCIGNIHDIDVSNPAVTKIGAPICGGLSTVAPHIDPYLIPTNKDVAFLGQPIEYEAADFSHNTQSQIYTIQSPVLMKAKPYMMKYRPFKVHSLGAGTALTKNETVIYDLSSRTNPIRYNVPIYSAGRPDIVFVFDTNKELVSGSSTNIQVLGGQYTMTTFIEDLVLALNMEKNPQVAVYAD